MAKLTDAKVRALRAVRDGDITFWGLSRGGGSSWSGPKAAHATSLYALRESGLITTHGYRDRSVALTDEGRAALEEYEAQG